MSSSILFHTYVHWKAQGGGRSTNRPTAWGRVIYSHHGAWSMSSIFMLSLSLLCLQIGHIFLLFINPPWANWCNIHYCNLKCEVNALRVCVCVMYMQQFTCECVTIPTVTSCLFCIGGTYEECYMLVIWSSNVGCFAVSSCLAQLIADCHPSIHQAQRGSLEDRGREGSIALVSGLKLKAVSATGLGWLWQSRGSIKGPTLIYNSVSV